MDLTHQLQPLNLRRRTHRGYEELLTALRLLCLEAVPSLGPAAFDFAHLPWIRGRTDFFDE